MNNVVMRKVVVAAEYAALSPTPLVGSVEISCSPNNTGDVTFKAEGANEVPWIKGEYHSFRSVDLSQILVKGTPGDIVTIIGGTW
jgi:hypothetical protein